MKQSTSSCVHDAIKDCGIHGTVWSAVSMMQLRTVVVMAQCGQLCP